MSLHVVVGAGPIGSEVARLLADAGHDVRIVTRRGSGPTGPRIQHETGDAADRDALVRITAGAAAIYNCANPPYHRWHLDWPPIAAALLAATEASGAVLVTTSNLYGYGRVDHPMVETDPLAATTLKGRVRAQMWRDALAAHQAGRVRATEARASDYFGPDVLQSQLGERTMPGILAGKRVSVVGSADALHSWTYAPDMARTLVTLAGDERAWGRAWHVPTNLPLTQRQAVAALAKAAGVADPGVRPLPGVLVAAAGLVSPMIRAAREMLYQFEAPFVIDSTATTTTVGLTPTPMDEALAVTVAWWRDHLARAA
jgi:nucleoside-diphosphate-sugar epimerase